MMHIVTLQRSTSDALVGFTQQLAALSDYHRRIMDNAWIVDTRFDPRETANLLRPHIGPRDQVFVGRLEGNFSGWLTRETWNWLTAASNGHRFR